MLRTSLAFLLATSASLQAQIIDTLGSLANPATTGSAKANLLAFTDSRILTDMEWHLNIPAGATTLTFFLYRHHSRTGAATLEWTLPVPVTGGLGPAWYSTGPLALPLTTGNHYALGVSYTAALTYYFSIAGQGAPFSFGSWQRGMTPPGALPPTLSFTGNDGAQYYQRLTTIPVSSVVNAGTGCGTTSLPPRLVAAGFFSIGTSQTLQLVDAAANAIGVFALAAGQTLPTPLPVFGCDLWLNLAAYATAATVTSNLGQADLILSIPNVPALVGQTYSSQALVFDPVGPRLSNGVQFTIN